MNGDWLYEELRVYPPEAWRLVQGLSEFPRIVDVMPTIVGVGENVTIDQYAADRFDSVSDTYDWQRKWNTRGLPIVVNPDRHASAPASRPRTIIQAAFRGRQ